MKLIHMTTFVIFIVVFMMNQMIVQANSFGDIKKLPINIQQEVLDLTNRKIIKGTSPTTFSPNTSITRGQAVVMLGRYIENNGIAKVDKNWERTDRFIDVPLDLKDRELLKYSTLLHDIGIFKGYNVRLYPKQPITLLSHNEFRVIEKYIPGGHGSVHMSLFLMHSFTGEHYKSLDTGYEYTKRTPYKDDPRLFMYFQIKDTGIIEHTITGNVMSVQNGEVIRTRKTVPYRYYYDYQGVMVTDTAAKNYIGDIRYEVTIGGDVYFEGKRITDREFYYLPIVRPVPFPGYNDLFAGFAYTDDVTLQQILAFHQTDGQISSLPKQYMHPIILVIDGEKNIYGTIDLRDATFGKFEEMED